MCLMQRIACRRESEPTPAVFSHAETWSSHCFRTKWSTVRTHHRNITIDQLATCFFFIVDKTNIDERQVVMDSITRADKHQRLGTISQRISSDSSDLSRHKKEHRYFKAATTVSLMHHHAGIHQLKSIVDDCSLPSACTTGRSNLIKSVQRWQRAETPLGAPSSKMGHSQHIDLKNRHAHHLRVDEVVQKHHCISESAR